jgi:hypothetical protein
MGVAMGVLVKVVVLLRGLCRFWILAGAKP